MSTERRQENKFILITDIVGHTKLIARIGPAYRPIRERHDDLFKKAIELHAPGALVRGTGDGFYVAFDDVSAAVETARMFRLGLVSEDWDKFLSVERRTPENHVKVRLGLHSGLVRVTFESDKAVEFDGQPRNLTDKVMSMASGNQILLTRQVCDQAKRNLSSRDEVEFKNFGEYKFRDVADTVEIWGLDEQDLAGGLRPIQPPEQRVIVFATIADREKLTEQAGPAFDELKDRWDHAFDSVVATHAKDPFVKRLPDGSLGAFKNAVEAVRIARDFRRALKLAMANSEHKLVAKLALDIGLVTFDYRDNRAVDVRDQPVNIAAKICKSSTLSQPSQLIMTRPVRSDAHENMPERAEFTWVCVGRKSIPGEPDAMELWEFQDLQSTAEERTVLWIDARAVKNQLKNQPAVWNTFRNRLDELLADVSSRRTEQPLVLLLENGLMAGFKDKVEAVQSAVELRDLALKEPWERSLTGVKRSGHNDNFLRMALNVGQLKHTREDGLLKDFRGAVVDGLKPVVEIAETSQILLTRELKEQVATAFPPTEVRWHPVSVTQAGGGEAGLEAFELRKVTKRKQNGLLIGAAAAGLLVVMLLVAVLMRGGGTGLPPDLGQVTAMVVEANNIHPTIADIGSRFIELVKAENLQLTKDKVSDSDRVTQITAKASSFRDLAEQWGSINALQLVNAERENMGGLKSLDDFAKWAIDAARKHALITDVWRKTGEWIKAIQEMELKLVLQRLDKSNEYDELAKLRVEVNNLQNTPLTGDTKDQIAAKSTSLEDRIGPKGTVIAIVDAAVETAKKAAATNIDDARKQAEIEAARTAQKGDLPVGVWKSIFTARDSDLAAVKQAGKAAERVANAYIAETPDKSAAERGAAFAALAKVLDGLVESAGNNEVDARELAADITFKMVDESRSLEELEQALTVVDQYRRPVEPDPRRREDWSAVVKSLKTELSNAGITDPALGKQADDIQARVNAIGQQSWIKRNQRAIVDESADIAERLKPDGALSTAVASAVERKKREDEQTTGIAKQYNDMFATTDVVADLQWAMLNLAWSRTKAGLQARKSDDNVVQIVAEGEDVRKRLADLPTILEGELALKPEAPGWEKKVAEEVQAARSEKARALIAGLDGKAAFVAEAFDTNAKKSAAALTALVANTGKWMDTVRSVEARLDAMGALADKIQGGQTLDALAQSAEDSKISDVDSVNKAVIAAAKPVLERVDRLRRIAKLDRAADIEAVLGEPGVKGEARLAVWKRLGEIESDGQPSWLWVQTRVAKVVAKESELPARWFKHISRLSDAGAIEGAWGRSGEFGVTNPMAAEEFKGLPLAAQYNLKLQDLKSLCIPGGGADDKVIAAADAVIAAGKGLPEAGAFIKLLEDAKNNVNPGGAAPGPAVQVMGLAEAGPAANKNFVFTPDGALAKYRMDKRANGKRSGAADPEIVFAKVAGPQGDVYISTTEVSVGLFFEVMDRGKWGGLADLFKRTDPKQLPMPSAWRRDADRADLGLGILRKAPGIGQPSWAPVAANEERIYPDGGTPPPPAMNHPINYVSVDAAVYFARLVGCRLPTAGEWASAAAGARLDGANLRDQSIDSFTAYQSNVKNLPPPVKDGTEGVFGTKPTKSYGFSDGKMFFSPVDEGMGAVGPFKNIVGNLAEWVYAGPDRMEMEESEVKEWMGGRIEQFRVVGGSALSEGGRSIEDLLKPIPVTGGMSRTRGFSDVGFRLAFSLDRAVNVVEVAPAKPRDRICNVVATPTFVAVK